MILIVCLSVCLSKCMESRLPRLLFISPFLRVWFLDVFRHLPFRCWTLILFLVLLLNCRTLVLTLRFLFFSSVASSFEPSVSFVFAIPSSAISNIGVLVIRRRYPLLSSRALSCASQ